MLTIEKRKQYFKALGLGEYNKANILKFEKRYLPSKYCDGVYGTVTDNLLRHCINVKSYTKDFRPEEFKCKCGKCSGYPSYMKMNELKNLQTIRTHYGKPMTVTSGLRCKYQNSILKGSSATSKHLTGQACDFYIAGVTDTLAHRKSTIAYIKTLPNVNWSYGNGISTKGYVSAPNMGNAMHIDSLLVAVKPAPVKTAHDKAIDAGIAYAKKLVADNSLGYKKYDTTDHACPICHPKTKVKGFNCIGFVTAVFAHGVGDAKMLANCKKNNGAGTGVNPQFETNIKANWIKHNGSSWTFITNGGKLGGADIPQSKLKPLDVLLGYNGNGKYKHTMLYLGGGKIADSKSSGTKANQISIRNYSEVCKSLHITRAFRYTGKGKF